MSNDDQDIDLDAELFKDDIIDEDPDALPALHDDDDDIVRDMNLSDADEY